mgnify:CR=1 FL=1
MNLPGAKTRVLLVDDSPIAIRILLQILGKASDIEVVGTAKDGKQALKMIASLDPEVVCTDLHMPEMDGLELVQRIMADFPRPILVVSVSTTPGSRNVFQLLEAGALDVVVKPKLEQASEFSGIADELLNKIRILAGVHVFHKRKKVAASSAAPAYQLPEGQKSRYRMIVIGASTGGPQALLSVLSKLPQNFPVPIVCVQHISDGFLKNLLVWLADSSLLKYQLAHAGQLPQAGVIYFPPERMQLKFDAQGRFMLEADTLFHGHCPSVSVTMLSAAMQFADKAVGVLLTGMGDDGADGMLAMNQAGGLTIAQDENSCVVFGMPKQAIAMGAARRVLDLELIAGNLIALCRDT